LKIENKKPEKKKSYFLMSVASLYTLCFVMLCVFLYGPFCHGAHKLLFHWYYLCMLNYNRKNLLCYKCGPQIGFLPPVMLKQLNSLILNNIYQDTDLTSLTIYNVYIYIYICVCVCLSFIDFLLVCRTVENCFISELKIL